MTHNLDRMNQSDFQKLRAAQSQADVLKDTFNILSPTISDNEFKKSKHWVITKVITRVLKKGHN